MGGRWRVDYEEALIAWIERHLPSRLDIIAVLRWAATCKVRGKPEDAVASPHPDRSEDWVTIIPLANVDVLYLAYEATTEGPLIFVREFTSF